MKIVIGSDHAGFPLKAQVIEHLKAGGHEIEDVGSFDPKPVDFPDIARLVCDKVRGKEAERGLLVCGTGVGAAIAANKIRGIRAAVCHDVHSAHQSVEHDDVNVMCIGAQIVGPWLANDLVDASSPPSSTATRTSCAASTSLPSSKRRTDRPDDDFGRRSGMNHTDRARVGFLGLGTMGARWAATSSRRAIPSPPTTLIRRPSKPWRRSEPGLR